MPARSSPAPPAPRRRRRKRSRPSASRSGRPRPRSRSSSPSASARVLKEPSSSPRKPSVERSSAPTPTAPSTHFAPKGSDPTSRLGVVETISLARGIPAPECIPVDELADCARAAIERDGTTVLSYGPVGGYQPLREWIAERHGVEPARVLVTNGSLQGIAFLADRFAGGRVLVEQPTYDRPLKLLAARGAEITPIAMDDEGLDPDALAEALGAGPKPAFLYTRPTFQNPSGRTLSVDRPNRRAA